MAAETDQFIIAMFALWAGDFSNFENKLLQFSPPQSTEPVDDGAARPEEFIRASGALRLRQFWQKRGEFKKLAAEYRRRGIEIHDTPIVLETKHLRATLWRITEREFQLQGYLTDLKWEESLFASAHLQALRTAEKQKPRQPRRKGQPEAFAPEPQSEPFKTKGTSWVIPGDMFLQVELSDLGLIEATGIWTKLRLPPNAEGVTAPFQQLLSGLETPTGK